MRSCIYISFVCILVLVVSCNRKITTSQTNNEPTVVIENKAEKLDKLDTEFVLDTAFKKQLNDTSLSNIFVKFQQTPCYGQCPTFEVIVYKNGLATLHGIRYFDRIGHYQFQLSSDMMLEISEAIEKAGFFDMADSYPISEPTPTDLPKTIITVQNNGSTKKVVDNRYNTPAQLTELERYMNNLWLSLPWEQL